MWGKIKQLFRKIKSKGFGSKPEPQELPSPQEAPKPTELIKDGRRILEVSTSQSSQLADEEILEKARVLCGVNVRKVKFLPDDVAIKANYALLLEKVMQKAEEGEEVYIRGLTDEGLRLVKKENLQIFFAPGVFDDIR